MSTYFAKVLSKWSKPPICWIINAHTKWCNCMTPRSQDPFLHGVSHKQVGVICVPLIWKGVGTLGYRFRPITTDCKSPRSEVSARSLKRPGIVTRRGKRKRFMNVLCAPVEEKKCLVFICIFVPFKQLFSWLFNITLMGSKKAAVVLVGRPPERCGWCLTKMPSHLWDENAQAGKGENDSGYNGTKFFWPSASVFSWASMNIPNHGR